MSLQFHPPGVLLANQVLVVVDQEQKDENGLEFTFKILSFREMTEAQTSNDNAVVQLDLTLEVELFCLWFVRSFSSLIAGTQKYHLQSASVFQGRILLDHSVGLSHAPNLNP